MAFYSVRVDDEGKDIQTPRQTFRKLYLDNLDRGTVREKTCPDSTQRSTANTMNNNYKTVRYVNSATFIEKDSLKQKQQLSEEEEEAQDDDENLKSDRSDYNSDDINDQQYQTHIDCDTVPLLELNSNESFPSSNNMTYSYRKVCEVTKMIQKPDAYKEWLDAKKTEKVYKKKQQLEKKKSEEEEKKQRKKLAEEKFQEWVAKKAKAKRKQEEARAEQAASKEATNLPEPIPRNLEEERETKEKNFQAWLKKKAEQEKFSKEKVNEDIKRERDLEKKRREQAAAIYDGWLKTAHYKPKPVPLNRGMLTLKGSVSEIYMNPIPWASLEDSESTNSL